MKFRMSKEQYNWGFTAFCVVAASTVFILLAKNVGIVGGVISRFLSYFIPFYIGFAIAYILNPIMRLFEGKVYKKLKKPQARRILALLSTYAIFLLLLSGVMAYLVPQLVKSITSLINDVPEYYKSFLNTVNHYIDDHPGISEFYQEHQDQISSGIQNALGAITNHMSAFLPRIASITLQVGTGMLQFFIGMIISIYFLLGKDRIIAQCKKFLTFVIKNEDAYQRVLTVGQVTHEKTLHFITARLLDSSIVAVLAYIVMQIFGFPYALLNALIIGVFNTIPYFGPWIGAVPPAIIILIVKPSMFLGYCIFYVILQQLDGNLIGPAIQGKQLGLSALWIMFAIFLFGGLFGLFGMVIGVPLFAVIYYFVNAAVNNGLSKQGKSADTIDYATEEGREILEGKNAKKTPEEEKAKNDRKKND